MPEVPIRFVLFVFGDQIPVHCQAYMALLTTMAQAAPQAGTPSTAAAEFVVLTDHPEYYRWFGDRVQAVSVSSQTMTDWRQPSGFFWRMKIQAVRMAADLGPAHLVYLDSDILARQPLSSLATALAAGDVFMHEREFALGTSRRRGHRQLAEQLVGRVCSGQAITAETAMWNAGVVAVGADRRPLLDSALALCDDFCTRGSHTLHEQLAFSVSLHSTGRLRSAEAWFDHYWGNKRGFQESIAAQLAGMLVQGLDVERAIRFVAAHPIERPLMVRRRWWNQYFAKMAGAIY